MQLYYASSLRTNYRTYPLSIFGFIHPFTAMDHPTQTIWLETVMRLPHPIYFSHLLQAPVRNRFISPRYCCFQCAIGDMTKGEPHRFACPVTVSYI